MTSSPTRDQEGCLQAPVRWQIPRSCGQLLACQADHPRLDGPVRRVRKTGVQSRRCPSQTVVRSFEAWKEATGAVGTDCISAPAYTRANACTPTCGQDRLLNLGSNRWVFHNAGRPFGSSSTVVSPVYPRAARNAADTPTCAVHPIGEYLTIEKGRVRNH